MLGSNDSKCWNWEGDQKFEDEYVGFAEKLVAVLPDKLDLYLMTPPSVYKDYTNGASACKYQDNVANENIPKAFPNILRRLKLDAEHNFVDTHHLTWGKHGDFWELYHEEGADVGDRKKFDRCHPNTAAHYIWARELYSRMKFRINEVLD